MDATEERAIAKKCLGRECTFVIGTDEAGRGPLAGPVAVAAVCVKVSDCSMSMYELLNDSKLMKEADRNTVFKQITDSLSCEPRLVHDALLAGKMFTKVNRNAASGLIGLAVSFESWNRIDEINILNASLEGMSKCVASLVAELHEAGLTKENTVVLIDGNRVPWSLLEHSVRQAKLAKQVRQKRLKVFVGQVFEQLEGFRSQSVVGGDRKCPSISAASVVAKVTRDEFAVETMCKAEPKFEFSSHKGYPTPRHMELLARLGPGQYHRKTFRPVIEASLKKKPTKVNAAKKAPTQSLKKVAA